jgi:hypothetical protein
MNDIIVGSIIVWALGRVLKKKADQPAPGTIDLPKQQRMQQQLPPQPGSTNYPSTSGGAGGPAYNPNNPGGGPGGGRPGQL